MGSQWQPDIVIGIDFGMTCTGVAWSLGPEWPEPKTIQRWPGKLGHELRNKVDTCISYDIHNGQVTSWGFLCNEEDERFEFNKFFKLYLDSEYKDPTPDAPSVLEAQTWYRDYLSCLYRYIMRYFDDTIPRFRLKKIDFVFSVPVTWRRNPAMIAELEKIIKTAGFGSNHLLERSSVYLTEAEAAAIYAAKQSMQKGEVYLVCDAGGGTTDLNVLKVQSTAKNQMELVPLSWTEGEAVGSTLIDYKIKILIRERLSHIKPYLNGDIDSILTRMMQDKFETFKCSFGSPEMDVPRLFLPVPGLEPNMDIRSAMIRDSKMVITREELQTVFDDQVEKMFNLIDRQLQIVSEKDPTASISYLVLSGGLGSSPYVKDRIRERYEPKGSPGPGAQGMKVLLANEPQLTVVHGLVMSRIQSTRGGPEMYSLRMCPISFGIVCREMYIPGKHQGEDVSEDPYDKKKWAERQINWIIKQGQIVPANTGASQRYRLKLDMGREREPWRTRIVMSTLPISMLPSSLKRDGAKEVCGVETMLDPRDMKRKNRHWYQFGREYNRAEFEVRVLVGTGLRFEIWSKDGIRSREHEQIEIQWQRVDEQAAGVQRPPEPGLGIYRW